MRTVFGRVILGAIVALVLAGAGAAGAQGGRCVDPPVTLVIEPLNPIAGADPYNGNPPAIVNDAEGFRFAVFAVSYDQDGNATAHGCYYCPPEGDPFYDPECEPCADLRSVVGSLQWQVNRLPQGIIDDPAGAVGETVAGGARQCLRVRGLSLGPRVSVSLSRPTDSETTLPQYSSVNAAQFVVPAEAVVSRKGSSTVGFITMRGWDPSVEDCQAANDLVFSAYTPVTRSVAFSNRLACSVSQTPSAILFARE